MRRRRERPLNRINDTKGSNMTKIVATHKVTDVARWKKFESERRENIGAFASEITGYVDPNGGDTVAVTMTVHDPEGFQAFLQSDACAAIMERHGVIQPVTFLTSQDR
jgi:hypothetical protein